MAPEEVSRQFERRGIAIKDAKGDDHEFYYCMLKPDPFEQGKRYPVILYLHGKGERGNDNKSQLAYLPEWMASAENRKKYPCFLIAPQCPMGEYWTWETKSGEEIGPLRMAAEMVLNTAYGDFIDPARVYLTGLSKGGYGAWELAIRMPERFAAVVPICGGGDETKADRLASLPIWAWHGDADDRVPVDESRKMIAAIKKAGGNPKYTELPGVGHDESWQQAYNGPNNVLPWLFGQTNPHAAKP